MVARREDGINSATRVGCSLRSVPAVSCARVTVQVALRPVSYLCKT
jgi:hypothetical protein